MRRALNPATRGHGTLLTRRSTEEVGWAKEREEGARGKQTTSAPGHEAGLSKYNWCKLENLYKITIHFSLSKEIA